MCDILELFTIICFHIIGDHDLVIKKYMMMLNIWKVHHDVKSYVIKYVKTSKSTSLHHKLQKACHDIKNNYMASKAMS